MPALVQELFAPSTTVAQARRALTDIFRQAELDSPELDARLLVGHALGLDHTALTIESARGLGGDAHALAALAARRLEHEPVARILGVKEFWGLPLRLSPATLVPRPDTETVVEAALEILRTESKCNRPLRIADLGTGSGAILLALLSELPNAFGIGTDISMAALQTARANARYLRLASRAAFVACDYAAALSASFDLIVSNPPYIRSADIAALDAEVRDHDPHRALDGGVDGLDAYRLIAPEAAQLLAPGGALVVEAGHGQSGAVAGLMAAAGLTAGETPKPDLAGIRRAVTGRLLPR